ncbi:hypothetical protein G9A89_017913 [Geosiphon pyriformis]|nr:hypothetical protein G9A89_017913 [Geosiphon pyriformis]
MSWKMTVTTPNTRETNNEASTVMSSTGLCSGVGETEKLTNETASNLFSLHEMSATWSNTFLSEHSRTLICKGRIITTGIELLTDPMSKLVSINSVEDKFLEELLTTEAQVAPPKKIG